MEGQHELDNGGQSGRATVLSLAQGLGVDFVPLSALQFLDAPDIARCGRANRFLYISACDEGLWQEARDRLWEGKVFVLERARALRAKAGYIASLEDSKRTWLELEELTSFSWWFRFKKQAGDAWTAQDPWYRNEKVPTVEFKSDHTVLRHGDMSLPPAANIKWRFVTRTGIRSGPQGSFIRASIGGREVPTYIVFRHPSNWGFLLESCWTLYTSWEMPPRDGPDCDPLLLDDDLKVTMDDQWEEAMSFNTGLSFTIYDLLSDVDNDESDDEEVEEHDQIIAHAAAALQAQENLNLFQQAELAQQQQHQQHQQELAQQQQHQQHVQQVNPPPDHLEGAAGGLQAVGDAEQPLLGVAPVSGGPSGGAGGGARA